MVAGQLQWRFREDRIAAESLLDGCDVIVTDTPPEAMNSHEVVAAYKNLRHVETAFRNLKTVRGEMRPVHHKTDDRIRTQVFICMLSTYLPRHMQRRLKPLFAANEEGAQREWTCANVLEKLKAIRRHNVICEKVRFRQVSSPEEHRQTT